MHHDLRGGHRGDGRGRWGGLGGHLGRVYGGEDGESRAHVTDVEEVEEKAVAPVYQEATGPPRPGPDARPRVRRVAWKDQSSTEGLEQHRMTRVA